VRQRSSAGMSVRSIQDHHQVESGNMVMHERTDTLTVGGCAFPIRVMGVFEVDDGLILPGVTTTATRSKPAKPSANRPGKHDEAVVEVAAVERERPARERQLQVADLPHQRPGRPRLAPGLAARTAVADRRHHRVRHPRPGRPWP
jgi:hypothetical protein